MGNRGPVIDRKIGFYYAIISTCLVVTIASVIGVLAASALELALLAFVGMWFTIYWMDMTERRFEATAGRIFWRRWFSVRGVPATDGLSGEEEPTV